MSLSIESRVTFRSLLTWSAAFLLSVVLVPGAALAAGGVDWIFSGGGARLVGPDGGDLYSTPHQVVGQRAIDVTGTGLTLVLWDEEAADRSATSHYAIVEDGQRLVGRVRQTTYDVGLVRHRFDPLTQNQPVRESHLMAREDNRIFLVQSWVPPIEPLQERVRAAGGVIHRYLTDHAMIVEMDPGVRSAVEALPFVRWVGAYHPLYRVDPPLRPLVAQRSFPGDAPPQRYSMMVYERGARQQQELGDVIRALGGKVEVTTPEGFRMEATLTPDQLAEVIHDNRLQYVDEWGPGEVDMDNVRLLGGADYLEAETGYTGQGVRGEIFDTELRTTHQEFATNAPIIHSVGTTGAVSHGTSVTSNVFAEGVDPSARGMCPDGQPIFFRYTESSQFGGATSRYTINQELLDPAGPYRAVFQTSSVGSPRTFFYTTISAETDDYLFLHQVLSTQSQSNAGNQDSRPQAWSKNIVSVGGFRHFNNADRSDDTWSFTGSIGPADDGRIKPDLSYYYDNVWAADDDADNDYRNFGGTSSATPQTAGHFGLLFQMWHEGVWAGHGGGATVFDSRPQMATAKALMIHTAYQYDWTVAGPNDDIDRFKQGWGTAHVGNLYDTAGNTTIIDESVILTHGGSHTEMVSLPGGADGLKATLVYVDPQGTPGATEHRINDLSLRVTSPSGTVYWGNNGLTADLVSTSGGVSNTLDTVENVFLDSVEAGDWTIEVLADEVVEDSHLETGATDVDFALVYSFEAAGIFADGFESGDTTAWSAVLP